MNCGCLYVAYGAEPEGRIVYCPLHAAAPALLEALHGMMFVFDRNFEKGTIGGNVCDESRAAIRQAEDTK